jgi:hypothetical protein
MKGIMSLYGAKYDLEVHFFAFNGSRIAKKSLSLPRITAHQWVA